ncbi:restriction endonuclease subunit S [Staphylococcus hominis]|uniref:restriction endonuclease subunit S n=1 Tax=Staphylococcus hominis TaxID=1290 RepID=UPI0031BB5385
MTNEVKNVPEIRFPEFSGEWEENKLNNYLKTSKIKNTQKKYNKQDVLSVSGYFGIVNQIEFQGRSFAGASVASYGIVETGDIVYTKSPLKSSPYGIIKVNKGESGIVSTLYAIYKPLQNVDANFVENYFTNDLRLNKYLKPLVNKGAKNDMKVSDDNALIGDVIFPKYIEEQIKISKFFSKLDRQIELEEEKLELLEQQKRGYMQKLFSQELRFKDYNGNEYPNWEVKKLQEIIEVKDGTHESPKPIDKGYLLVTSKNLKNNKLDFSESYNISKEDYENINKRSKVEIGDILFGMIGTIGNPILLKEEGFAIKNVALLKTNNLQEKYFILNFLKSIAIAKQFHKMNAGGTQKFISLGTIRNLKIDIPSPEEAIKIGDFLNKIDELIENQSKKIDFLKQRKKGLLQKMFV